MSLKQILVAALATTLLSLTSVAKSQSSAPAADEADLAVSLAPRIVQVIGQQRLPRPRVAVFPFGNSRGRINGLTAETSEILRGELIEQLAKNAAGQLHVLDKDGLAREFRDAGTDASAVSFQDAQATAQVLQKIGVDAAVTGSINFSEQGLAADVSASVVFQSGESIPLTAEVRPAPVSATSPQSPAPLTAEVRPTSVPVNPPQAPTDRRFNVEVLVEGRALPLQRSTNPDSGYFNAVFLVLPRQVVGMEYQLRVTNRGVASSPAEARRLIGAVVTVDGVNSFYQDNGRGQFGPVVRHPKNCAKWILTSPGQTLVPDANSAAGYRMDATTGSGHSVVTIPGFQNGTQLAKAFTFAKVRDSVAENIGITNDIGIISVHFYPDDLARNEPSVPVTSKSLGATRPGRDVANSVFKVRPRLAANPVVVWRIFYRYEDDPSLNQLSLQPVMD